MKLDKNLKQNRYEWAAETIAKLNVPAPLVYDIGCGDGRMRKFALAAGMEWRGFDRDAWEMADSWDLSNPCPLPDKAGAVLLLDVLEHTISPGLALQNISNAMATDGKLILTMPNPRWSASRIYTLAKGYTSSFRPEDVDENHHIFPIWPHAVERLLQYAGLTVDTYVTLDGPTKIRLSRLPIDLARLAIEALDAESIGMGYGVVAIKHAPTAAVKKPYDLESHTT